jgi:hypothetical protein
MAAENTLSSSAMVVLKAMSFRFIGSHSLFMLRVDMECRMELPLLRSPKNDPADNVIVGRVHRAVARRLLAEQCSIHAPERCYICLDMANLLSAGSAGGR